MAYRTRNQGELKMFNIIKMFVDEGKIAGWVRAAVAAIGGSGLGLGICKILPATCGAEFQTALSVVLTTIAVGLWSSFVKSA
jgi:hypothetical protein